MAKTLSKYFACSALLLLALVAACTLMPKAAFADLQSGTADLNGSELKENSWRYRDGVPLNQPDEGAEKTFEPAASMSSDGTMTHLGIDVSQHNGIIDWAKVRGTTVKYAILRCGYGSDYASQDDTHWKRNVQGCRSNNIPFGVYLYSYAMNPTMAKSEGNHVVRCLREAGLSPADVQFPIFYDVENTGKSADQSTLSPAMHNQMFQAFRSALNAAGYSKVGVYSSAMWWRDKWNTLSLDADYRWIARYGTNDGSIQGNPCTGFPTVQANGCGLWQYTSVGRVNGISGSVDMNLARSDLRFLQQSGSALSMYRLFNPYTGEHFYTCNAAECGQAERDGWRYEGVAWRVPAKSSTPVYRVYNPWVPGGDHHFTIYRSEYLQLLNMGWRDEGIGWYSAGTDQVPTHRLLNPTALSGAHHYTASDEEKAILLRQGWRDEGGCWFGLK